MDIHECPYYTSFDSATHTIISTLISHADKRTVGTTSLSCHHSNALSKATGKSLRINRPRTHDRVQFTSTNSAIHHEIILGGALSVK
jgi:hypothetical protein